MKWFIISSYIILIIIDCYDNVTIFIVNSAFAIKNKQQWKLKNKPEMLSM